METVKKTSIEGNNLRYCWHGVMKVGSPMGMTFLAKSASVEAMREVAKMNKRDRHLK